MPKRTAGEKSISPENCPFATTISGLSGLGSGATIVNDPLTLPRPVARLILSEPVAFTVHVVLGSFGSGHSGVPEAATPINAEVALRWTSFPPTNLAFSVVSQRVG